MSNNALIASLQKSRDALYAQVDQSRELIDNLEILIDRIIGLIKLELDRAPTESLFREIMEDIAYQKNPWQAHEGN